MVDGLPVSKSSKVLLSPVGGGCGCIIPYRKNKADLTRAQGPILCGMESSSIPNHYFICAECHGKKGDY